jgi:hypothetical protein
MKTLLKWLVLAPLFIVPGSYGDIYEDHETEQAAAKTFTYYYLVTATTTRCKIEDIQIKTPIKTIEQTFQDKVKVKLDGFEQHIRKTSSVFSENTASIENTPCDTPGIPKWLKEQRDEFDYNYAMFELQTPLSMTLGELVKAKENHEKAYQDRENEAKPKTQAQLDQIRHQKFESTVKAAYEKAYTVAVYTMVRRDSVPKRWLNGFDNNRYFVRADMGVEVGNVEVFAIRTDLRQER